MTTAEALLVLTWFGLTAYALLGGADFGGGVWDLVARGPRAADQRRLIARIMGPVWEANHVWLVFVIVLLFSCFPAAFALLAENLELPFGLALIGIVFRGAAFAFRGQERHAFESGAGWGSVFAVASLLTPFVLGAAAATIATGKIRLANEADLVGVWTGPLPMLAGLFGVTICAYLAAVFLSRDAQREGDLELEDLFRRRALAAGFVAGVLAMAGLPVMAVDAPQLWEGFTQRAPGFLALSVAGGAGTIMALLRRRYVVARIAAGGAVAGVLWGWAAAQYPYLVIPDLTIADAAAPESVLRTTLIAALLGLLLLAPALWLLFRVFRGTPLPKEKVS